jgi:phage host-nuclease inhibitor protein Gam
MPKYKKDDTAAPAAPTPTPIPTDIDSIASWQDVDVGMGVLRRTDAELSRVAIDVDEQIAQLEATKLEQSAPLVARRDRIETAITEYSNAHRAEIKLPAKSVKLTHGVVGWKKAAPKVELAGTEEATIKLLKLRGHTECIRVTEEIDKKKLLDLGSGEARLCGVTITQTERLNIKLNQGKLVEYPVADESDDAGVGAAS